MIKLPYEIKVLAVSFQNYHTLWAIRLLPPAPLPLFPIENFNFKNLHFLTNINWSKVL